MSLSEKDPEETMCSTPFGIGDKYSASGDTACGWKPRCSTPFGIGDKYRGRSRSRRTASFRAQRLSASEINTDIRRVGASMQAVCSTPFGIGDKYSRAFLPDPAVSLCAQRLSASEINTARSFPRQARACTCAQRLSASEINTGRRSAPPRRRPDVLNAFRHRR